MDHKCIILLLHLSSDLRFIQFQILIWNKSLHITEHPSISQCHFRLKKNLILLIFPS